MLLQVEQTPSLPQFVESEVKPPRPKKSCPKCPGVYISFGYSFLCHFLFRSWRTARNEGLLLVLKKRPMKQMNWNSKFASNETSRGMSPKCTPWSDAKHARIVWLDKKQWWRPRNDRSVLGNYTCILCSRISDTSLSLSCYLWIQIALWITVST